MPLFYQHNINEQTRLGIWQIKEPDSFFLEKVPLKRDVSHPHKRLQHLAGRYLLPALFPDFPLAEIVIADTRKPFLENERYHFSISHCGDFAAAIASRGNRVGVDIELVTPKIERIRHKFLNAEEEALAGAHFTVANEKSLLTLLWSAKETVYKWYGAGLVDFRQHMRLTAEIVDDGKTLRLPFLFEKHAPITLEVHARFFDSLVLAWVIS